MPRLCPRHGARQGRTPGAMIGRRASRLAPPFTHAKFARNIRTRITRAARWGHRALPPLHPQYSHAQGAPPLRAQNSHAHYARGGSPPRPTAITHAPPPVAARHHTRRARGNRLGNALFPYRKTISVPLYSDLMPLTFRHLFAVSNVTTAADTSKCSGVPVVTCQVTP